MNDRSNPLVSRLRLKQLQIISDLCESLNMRATADRLHMSPAAVSVNVREVESLVGFQIFERTTAGLSLSPAGESFLRSARLILAEIDSVMHIPENPNASFRNMVRLGSQTYMGWTIVPRMVRHLHAKGALPQFRLYEERIVPLVERLMTGELDIAISMITAEVGQVLEDTSLFTETICNEDIVVVASPSLAKSFAGDVPWKHLQMQSWILAPSRFITRRMVDDAFLQSGIMPPTPLIESSSQEGPILMAKDGLGFAVVPRSSARESLDDGSLVSVRLEKPLPSIPVALLCRSAFASYRLFRELREAVSYALVGPPQGGVSLEK